MEKQYLPEIIVSSRVTLKKLHLDLADKMFRYVIEDKERLSVFLPWPQFITKVDDEIDYIKKSNESWEKYELAGFGIFRNDDDEFMGNVGVVNFHFANESAEIGYWILGKFEGHGYMSEAVKVLEENLYKLGFNRIVIRTDPENHRSSSIPKRLGYTHEGTLREVVKLNDSFRSLEVFSKLKSDLARQNRQSS